MDGVVNEVLPVANAVPPVEAAYQSIVSLVPGVEEMTTVPVPQRLPFTATGVVGVLVIDAATAVLLAETQPPDKLLASA